MTRGYLYLAFGDYYVQELNNLALTMQRNGNTLPMSVVCTENEVDTLSKAGFYDELLVFDFNHELYKEKNLTQFESYCLIPRLLLNHLTPYDETIVTDTDVLCQYNASHVWEIVNNTNNAVVMTGINHSPNWHFGYNHEVSANLGKNVPETHGGFFFIRKHHEDVSKFFELAIDVYNNYDNYKLRRMFRGGRVDEPIFAIVNALMGYEVLEFDKYPIIAFNYTEDMDVPSKYQTYPRKEELQNYIPFIHMFKPHGVAYSTLLNKILSQ